ncbi:hypothetical protein FA13DRAFT_1341150 [Coprinellus micaceus]|uniref:Secreted protein n=1 Tax=Coprinellus micaceus TaxID=71717 RepID=A0A4Y7TMK1_COPMI|nr:hypothetical protein FA13DRAFT_1341150 [Coprinellus micaceus]
MRTSMVALAFLCTQWSFGSGLPFQRVDLGVRGGEWIRQEGAARHARPCSGSMFAKRRQVNVVRPCGARDRRRSGKMPDAQESSLMSTRPGAERSVGIGVKPSSRLHLLCFVT